MKADSEPEGVNIDEGPREPGPCVDMDSRSGQILYLENQHTILTEKNKALEATINFYKELLNRTIECYAAEKAGE